MKADKIDDRWLVKEGDTEAWFTAMTGAIGYGDPAGEGDYALHAIVVVGRHQDGRLIVIAESLGSMVELKPEACNLKDRFLVREIVVDATNESFLRELQNHDGLCAYKSAGKSHYGKPKYIQQASVWPHFRNRKTKAVLIPADETLLAEFDSEITVVAGLISQGRVAVADWCIKTRLLVREDFAQGRKHPLLKALVLAVSTLEMMNVKPTKTEETEATWYRNRR